MKYLSLCVLAYFIGLAPILAQETAIKGFYVSVDFAYQSTEGDLTGDLFLYTDQEIFLVPDIAGGFGWGIGIGTRGISSAFELNYTQTKHDATFADSKGEAILRVFSLDYIYFFRGEKNFQPYLQFGWCPGYTLKIIDGSANISPTPEVRDSKLYGSIGSIQLGGGISYVLYSRMNIVAGITYRSAKYTGVAGGKDIVSARIEEPLNGSGLNALLSLNYFLSKGK